MKDFLFMLVSGVEIWMNLSIVSMILSWLLHLQYDPEAKNCPNLFYHFIDEQVPDILIAKIHKHDIHRASFHVSDDYRYLILCDSQFVSIAAIDSINKRIRFKSIVTVSQDTFYVNILSHFLLILTKILIIHLKTTIFFSHKWFSGICWQWWRFFHISDKCWSTETSSNWSRH